MSESLEKLETERLLAVKEDLTETNYNQLKYKLTEIGAGDAWQQGEKKEIIIAKALQILESSKKDSEEVKNKVLETKIEEINTEIPENEEKPLIESVINPILEIKPEKTTEEDFENFEEVKLIKEEIPVYGEEDPRKYVSKLTPNVSLEDLEKNLDRIQLLMKGANTFHKMILLEKSKQIEAKIKELIQE